MKSNLYPPDVLIGVGEIKHVYPDGTCDIKFNYEQSVFKLDKWIIQFPYKKLLSNRDVNKFTITSGSLINWHRKTYKFLNKKYEYDYFKLKKCKPFTKEDLERIEKEAVRLAELLKDR